MSFNMIAGTESSVARIVSRIIYNNVCQSEQSLCGFASKGPPTWLE